MADAIALDARACQVSSIFTGWRQGNLTFCIGEFFDIGTGLDYPGSLCIHLNQLEFLMDTKESKRLNPAALLLTSASVARTLSIAKNAQKSGVLRVLPLPQGVPVSRERKLRVRTISATA